MPYFSGDSKYSNEKQIHWETEWLSNRRAVFEYYNQIKRMHPNSLTIFLCKFPFLVDIAGYYAYPDIQGHRFLWKLDPAHKCTFQVKLAIFHFLIKWHNTGNAHLQDTIFLLCQILLMTLLWSTLDAGVHKSTYIYMSATSCAYMNHERDACDAMPVLSSALWLLLSV